MPGVATPTEAFAALAAGADALKMFPAELLGAAVLKAWRAVLPSDTQLVPVGDQARPQLDRKCVVRRHAHLERHRMRVAAGRAQAVERTAEAVGDRRSCADVIFEMFSRRSSTMTFRGAELAICKVNDPVRSAELVDPAVGDAAGLAKVRAAARSDGRSGRHSGRDDLVTVGDVVRRRRRPTPGG
jgi:hypothetical protein